MMKKIHIFLIFLIISQINLISGLSIDLNVPEKYTEVNAGERFYFEISIKYPENPQRKDLRIEYFITDSEGGLISQSKALKAVETQASFIDFIVIPETAKTGFYIITAKIKDYEKLSEEVSASFNVKGKGIDQIKIYFLIIIMSIFLVGFIVVLNIRKMKRR